jgi:hypothetical protein
MQALSDMEGLSVAANDTLGRILELQNKLTAKGALLLPDQPNESRRPGRLRPGDATLTKN